MNSSLWTLFHEKMSREEDQKTLQEECKDAKEAFLRRRKIDRERRVRESAAERQQRLKIIRDNKASRRALETTEQREKRLGTDRKQAALKRASETGQERERRLRAMRELATKKRATESSQEKELQLRGRRVDEQPQREPPGNSRDWPKNETRKAADNRRRNERAALFEAHYGEYLHNRGWANPENRGLHHEEWAQEEMAAFHRFEENLRHYHCVICKEAWPLSASRQQIFTCSRCKRDRKPCRLYSAENDINPGSVPAELQGLSEVEELLIARAFPIMSNYRKHGGQRGYKGRRTQSAIAQDIQDFLNSLPANMSDLSILVIRKQGAGESLK